VRYNKSLSVIDFIKIIDRIDLSDRELYRLEEVARVDSAARTSPDNPCSSPGARPSPKQDPDESWDFWAERRPETGQFHPREPSRNIMFSTDFTLAPYSLANLFERFDLSNTRSAIHVSVTACNLQHSVFTHSIKSFSSLCQNRYQ